MWFWGDVLGNGGFWVHCMEQSHTASAAWQLTVQVNEGSWFIQLMRHRGSGEQCRDWPLIGFCQVANIVLSRSSAELSSRMRGLLGAVGIVDVTST